ncbi:glutamate racemase [Candidatus Gracilibacteria bacterium]|nr:glutamate racemase [Candidatus Gracilibacteria bacterium]
MRIGFFDSGLGGQVVMAEFQKEFPEIEMILEMDSANAPYGHRSGDEIRMLTIAGVERLHARGADVVILACNTASVYALRHLQTEVFVGYHILGVTVPGAEAVVDGGYHRIGVLATDATVRSRMYRERVNILDDSIIVEEISAPGLVPLIEAGIISGPEIDTLLREYLAQFSPDIEALVLGCTHYPLISDSIEHIWMELYDKKIPDLIDPGEEAAMKFRGWMEKKGY